MSKDRDKVRDPLIELLAIKLHEHSCQRGLWPPVTMFESWTTMDPEDREAYRKIARGEDFINWRDNP